MSLKIVQKQAAEIERLRDYVRALEMAPGCACGGDDMCAFAARLAEAVEVLRHYRCDCDAMCEVGDGDAPSCGSRARAVLAKLEGR